MEQIFRQKITVPDSATDCFGRLKTSSLLAYVQDIASMHCIQLGFGKPVVNGRQLAWIVSRHRVQVTRLPKARDTITLETWPCPATRVAYPRSVVAYDADGQELFRAMTMWVLVDAENRAMVVPGKSGVDIGGLLTGTELATPGSLMPADMSQTVSRTVNFTDLDINGHMNNCQYLNWVADLLPSEFHRDHPVKEFVICYLNEAREGQQVKLKWTLDGNLRVEARGEKLLEPGTEHRIFAADILY